MRLANLWFWFLLANSLCWAVYGWVLIVRYVEVVIR